MNKTTETTKNKPKYKQTESIRSTNAFYKSKEKWKAINDGATFCPYCKQQVLEEQAMEARNGQTIHEECYEPGEREY